MRTLFLSSLSCVVTSVLGVLTFSAMTVVPAARTFQDRLMVGTSVSLLIWSMLTVWIGIQLRRPFGQGVLPSWVRHSSVAVAIIYVLGFLLFVVG